jgi:hypothetical protein
VRRGDHEHRLAPLAHYALAPLPLADGSEAASRQDRSAQGCGRRDAQRKRRSTPGCGGLSIRGSSVIATGRHRMGSRRGDRRTLKSASNAPYGSFSQKATQARVRRSLPRFARFPSKWIHSGYPAMHSLSVAIEEALDFARISSARSTPCTARGSPIAFRPLYETVAPVRQRCCIPVCTH